MEEDKKLEDSAAFKELVRQISEKRRREEQGVDEEGNCVGPRRCIDWAWTEEEEARMVFKNAEIAKRELVKERLREKLKNLEEISRDGTMCTPWFTDEEYEVLEEVQHPERFDKNYAPSPLGSSKGS